MKQLQHGIYEPSIGEKDWGEEINQNFEVLDSLIGDVRDTKAKCDLLDSKIQDNTTLINSTKDSLQENITNAVNDLQEKIDALDEQKSNTDHNHDDRYYTESEIDSKLGEKSNTDHTHDNYLTGITKDMVTDALGYTPPEQDTNTTYSAGSNLSLTDTTFNVSSNPSFNSIYISGYKLTIG